LIKLVTAKPETGSSDRGQRASESTPSPSTDTEQPTAALKLDSYPYESFSLDFREVIGVHRVKETGAFLHVVFGDIAKVRHLPVVIPINQSFDFWQRGQRSVLSCFEGIRCERVAFFDYLEEIWPKHQRPLAAGLGHTKVIALPPNTQEMPEVMFAVTTRDLSADSAHYGLYVNTAIEGIDYVLNRALSEANDHQFTSIALPLLGAGYANVQRSPEARRLLNQAVLLLTIEKVEASLQDTLSTLRRGVIVVYSPTPYSEEEHEICRQVARFFGSRSRNDRQKQLDDLVQAVAAEQNATTRANR